MEKTRAFKTIHSLSLRIVETKFKVIKEKEKNILNVLLTLSKVQGLQV